MKKETEYQKRKERIEEKVIFEIIKDIVARNRDKEEIVLPIEFYWATLRLSTNIPSKDCVFIWGKKVKFY